MFATLRRDIQAFMDNDPAARSRLEILLAYPGLHALWFHRLAHALWRRRLYFLGRMVSQLSLIHIYALIDLNRDNLNRIASGAQLADC